MGPCLYFPVQNQLLLGYSGQYRWVLYSVAIEFEALPFDLYSTRSISIGYTTIDIVADNRDRQSSSYHNEPPFMIFRINHFL
jgi:hypothetical protein